MEQNSNLFANSAQPSTNFFSSCEKSLRIRHGDRPPGETRRNEFREKTFRKKPATHYSSLFANSDKTTFSQKKLSFAKSDEMGSTHYSSQTPVFANVLQKVKYDEKISLISSKNCLLWRTHFAKKFFRETFTNMKNYSLHTIRSSHGFHPFFLFCHCSRIVCSGLETVLMHSNSRRLMPSGCNKLTRKSLTSATMLQFT